MALLMRVHQAMLLHQNGRIAEAAEIYAAVLRLQPGQADCLHYLGVAKHQAGRSEEAVELIRKAISCGASHAAAHSNLGLALHRLGRLQDAIDSFDRALALDRRFADALNNRGNVLRDLGRQTEALANYDAAVASRPDHADAHANRAAMLAMLGRATEALGSYDKAVSLKPTAERFNGRGIVLRELKRFDEALASFEKAIALKPDYVDALGNKGNILYEMAEHRAAYMAYEKAVAAAPAMTGIRLKSLIARIPAIADEDDDIDTIRTDFAAGLAGFRQWLDENPVQNPLEVVGAAQPFYLAYHARNNRDLIASYGEICSRLMAHWCAHNRITVRPASATDRARIRVGIVSAHIGDHPVWTAIVRGWFQEIDRERFDLHVFRLGGGENPQTAFARSRAASFQTGPKSTLEWARLIVASELDVLVYPELGMDAQTPQLAASRLAPIQIATWGHPETTGLPTIDYYLSADMFEGEGADACYTERLIRLPNLGCHYEPEEVELADIDPAKIDIDTGRPLLVCPGAPFKYAAEYDRVFVDIARRVGDAQFLFFTNPASPALSTKFLRRLCATFRAAQLAPERHIVITPWQPRPRFYAIMRQADAFLDTIGFSGFNTAMQAVDCALPIVTMEGQFMRGRFAGAILKRIGLDELVHSSVAAYVDSAVRLASDPGYRDAMRAAMTARRHVLYKDVAPIRALEQMLWRLCGDKSALP